MPDEIRPRSRKPAEEREKIALMVGRMEGCLRAIADAQSDMKALVFEAERSGFRKQIVKAMKKVAKLRLDDKLGDARDQLAALQEVSAAVDYDLFAWAAH